MQVSMFIDKVNSSAISMRETNTEWKPETVKGVGPSRNFYFLSTEVVRGAVQDGFHRNERSIMGKPHTVDGVKYIEYPGFNCANRYFRVL